MCVLPAKLKNGKVVACRKCWQCRENRINDWVGRCLAEAEVAASSHSITLTYGRDAAGHVEHERAAVLTYSDVQKYFKLLRRHGYPCRYFAVGEYGSMKGRAHWHIMVFWRGPVPDHVVGQRFDEAHWPHGVSFWEEPSPASIRYICKYLQKDLDSAERQGHLAMSKKPPLGHDYFVGLAGKYVAQGLAPQSPVYWFDAARDAKGRLVQFYLAGVSLDNFCRSFLEQWEAQRGGHPPVSPLIEDYCDRVAPPLPFERVDVIRPRRFDRPWIRPPVGYEVRFDEPLNSFVAVDDAGSRLFWSFNELGERSWQNVIRAESEAERLFQRGRDGRLYRASRDGR